jgi:hypothetical protein
MLCLASVFVMQLLVRDRRSRRVNDFELLLVRHHLEVLRRKAGRPSAAIPEVLC